MADKKVRVGILASGGGSTGEKVMADYRAGLLPNVEVVLLVSTKADAGCIEKANAHEIPVEVIEEKDGIEVWNEKLQEKLEEYGVELLVLAGCVKEVFPIDGVPIYNTHPALTWEHGGRGMYGLAVHKHVLMALADEIARERIDDDDVPATYVNFHEVDAGIDTGSPLVQIRVDIPESVLDILLDEERDMEGALEEAAKALQQYVLQYEYLMLPWAVNLVAKKLLDEQEAGE